MKESRQPKKISRRKFLGVAGLGAGALALGGCGILPAAAGRERLPSPSKASGTGRIQEYSFEAAPFELELGGRSVPTWGYNEGVPGPEIRLTEGDTLRVNLSNRLPADTTIHWHGVPLINSMDGVPNVTQPPVAGGEDFIYEFLVPTAGTYMYHSHVNLQLDRGLYGPLIVEPKSESLSYDQEYTLMLDDWQDGLSGTPEETLEQLQSGGMGGGMMGGGMMGGMMGGGSGTPGAISYPLYLINGRTPDDPESLKVRKGEKIRLRLLNIGSDTVFRFAVAGHKLTVTHADGLPVGHVEVDAVRLGMGERYDMLLEANNPGVWQVAAAPEGRKDGLGRTLLRYEENGESSPPSADQRPKELEEGRFLSYGDLTTSSTESFPSGEPDRTHQLTLSGNMMNYTWAIDGQRYPDADPLEVSEGEWVRFEIQNMSMMHHPMHLHGHFYQIYNGTGRGPFKDTVMVEPHMGTMAFDFVADNPGEWFFHCHNLYHLDTGMVRVVSYRG